MNRFSFPVAQSEPPLPPEQTLPTMYDLPSEDPEEPGLPDEFHDIQPQLLSLTLRLKNYNQSEYFTGTDLYLYYDVTHTQWHKRPDWFLAVGVPRLYAGFDLRRSYVTWVEGKNPFIVVELLSPGTQKEDLGRYAEEEPETIESSDSLLAPASPSSKEKNGLQAKDTPPSKWVVYEQLLRVPYYIVFSRYTNRVRFFRLEGGHYQEQVLDVENPRIWIEELEIGLGLWRGEFAGVPRLWLRWYDVQGNWIPTEAELERTRAEEERAKAELERTRSEEERAKAEFERTRAEEERAKAELAIQQVLQTARNLLNSGMSIAQVSQLTGLPETSVQKLLEP
ncbi:MAG: Uma2 family endonuclease [Scytonema sp. PMC 1069.18]|nr:Uma2 family endonuclease [Scytonema sp. PMC 1069.18]MEC4883391.1 Uma2 family endonuclease [Scytonema sp. PMC 1070.18]